MEKKDEIKILGPERCEKIDTLYINEIKLHLPLFCLLSFVFVFVLMGVVIAVQCTATF